MCFSQWTELIQAIGTFLVIVIALLGAYGYWEKRKKPKLVIDPEPNIRWGVPLRFRDHRDPNIIWEVPGSTCIRMRIINTTKYTAKKVIVKVVKIETTQGNVMELYDPYRTEIVGYFESVDIYAEDDSNMFDLVQASDHEDPRKNWKKHLILCFSQVVEKYARGINKLIPRFDYIFTVAIFGDNIDPVVRKIKVTIPDNRALLMKAELLTEKGRP